VPAFRPDRPLEPAAEHGERALRALGGRREAERFLAEPDPTLDTRALIGMLERRASSRARS
jgi:LAO/AO transport system kinase